MDVKTCDAILPPGVSRQGGEPPPAPLSFEEGYVLPQHYDKPLLEVSVHPLDVNLKFYEKPHVYTWKDVPTSASVTALAHQFEKPFVAVDAIRSMKCSRSQAWPRLEYVMNAAPIEKWTSSCGAIMVLNGKTVAVVHPYSTSDSQLATLYKLMQSATIKGCSANVDDNDVELYSFERELTEDEIANKWSRKGMLASHMGTEAHYQAELVVNGLPFRWWEPEVNIFVEFARDHLVPNGIYAHAAEKEIVCVDADLAGSIDLIVFQPSTGLYHIIDHKRSDKLQKDLRGFGKMKAPFGHLEDCKGAGYALQTSLYQYILERDYNMPIGERVLLSLHPDRPFVTKVPYLKAEVEFIMETRFSLVKARQIVAKRHPQFRCTLSGAPAVDAVRLNNDSNKVAMEKAALVAGLRYRADETLRQEFEHHVAEEVESTHLKTEDCITWRKLMPETGIVPFV